MNQTTVNKIDKKASRFLGKQTHNYDLSYSPDLLVPIERSLNRDAYGITNEDFEGFDIWHNYECSFLLDNGYPLTLVGKIKIPSNSKYFIESKSMKLYFFSMHMKKFGKTKHEAIENYKSIVTKDLSSKVEKPVEFEVFDKLSYEDPFTDNFEDISCFADIDNLNFENYKESPDLLELSNKTGYFTLRFNGFRSNCRVTHQPDFSNIFIAISGNTPSMDSLVRYLVSFRNEFHFHEEVTEQIFKALKEKYKPNSLLVGNLFTRRGGIDICPIRRFNYPEQPIESIMDLTIPTIYQ